MIKLARTVKKFPDCVFRKPRGAKNARAAGVRYKAIPPDDYDDMFHDPLARKAYKVARRLAVKKVPIEVIERKLVINYGLRRTKARELARWAMR